MAEPLNPLARALQVQRGGPQPAEEAGAQNPLARALAVQRSQGGSAAPVGAPSSSSPVFDALMHPVDTNIGLARAAVSGLSRNWMVKTGLKASQAYLIGQSKLASAVGLPFAADEEDIRGGFQSIEKKLEEFHQRVADSPAERVVELVGEYGPDFIGVGVAANAAKKGVQKLVQGQVNRRYGGHLARSIEYTGNTVDKVAAIPFKPGQLRALEIAGESAAVGAFMGTSEAANGKPFPEVVKTALIAATLTGALGGAMHAGSRALGARRAGKLEEVRKRFTEPGYGGKGRSPRQKLSDDWDIAQTSLGKLESRLSVITGKAMQEAQFVAANAPAMQKKFGEKGAKALTEKLSGMGADYNRISQKVNAARTERDALAGLITATDQALYSGSKAFTPGSARKYLHQAAQQLISTPESTVNTYNSALWTKAMGQLRRADENVQFAETVYRPIISAMRSQAKSIMGLSNKQIRDGGFLGVADAFERGGVQAVEKAALGMKIAPDKAKQLSGVFADFEALLKGMHKEGIAVGTKGPIPMDGSLGVKFYLPHMGSSYNDGHLVKMMKMNGIEEHKIAEIMSQARSTMMPMKSEDAMMAQLMNTRSAAPGPGKLSMADFDRILKGTTRDKIKQGIPLNVDPFDSGMRYMNGMTRRAEYAKVLGPNFELAPKIVEGINREGGPGDLAANVLDNLVGRSYADTFWMKTAENLLGWETASKLTLAVIPNLTQTQNVAYMLGLNNMTNGLLRATSKEERKQIAHMLGSVDAYLHSLGRATSESGIAVSAAEKAAEFTLKYTGFQRVEAWNRTIAALATQNAIRDTIAKGVAGNLRGDRLAWSDRLFADLGLDLRKIVANARASGDDFFSSPAWAEMETHAVFRGMQKTQFAPSKLRRPSAWNTPLGRIASQFKTFALGQGKLLRDSVLRDAGEGNYAPLAYFTAIAPISGEAIAATRYFIKGKERPKQDVFDRILQDATYSGGLGLASDMISSARWGRTLDSIAGPVLSDVANLTGNVMEGLHSGEFDALRKQFTRMPAFQAGRGLLGGAVVTVKALDDYMDSTESESSATISLSELQAMRKQNR